MKVMAPPGGYFSRAVHPDIKMDLAIKSMVDSELGDTASLTSAGLSNESDGAQQTFKTDLFCLKAGEEGRLERERYEALINRLLLSLQKGEAVIFDLESGVTKGCADGCMMILVEWAEVSATTMAKIRDLGLYEQPVKPKEPPDEPPQAQPPAVQG